MQQAPLRAQQPLREPGDFRGTVRLTDWSAGFDVLRVQEFPFAVVADPGFWDSQNIDMYTVPGTFRLCSQASSYATYAADEELLYYDFGNNLYQIPTQNFVAADFKKVTSAVGAPANSALANVYPGAVAPRGAVVWRDQLMVASGETVVRAMSTGEIWGTIAAPAGVTAPICGQVGIYQDDRLLVWWEGTAQAGLYAWEGSTWVKVYPTAGTNPTTSSLTCDAIIRAPGSTIVFLRDLSGRTTLLEVAQQALGTTFETWLGMPGLRVWPQCGDAYQGDLWFVGRLGSQGNKGALFHKPLLAAPQIIQVVDTNYATAGQKGLDWALRCFKTVGNTAWIGGSSREDHTAAIYRFFIDPDNSIQAMMPTSVLSGVVGPVYSIGVLPPGATGVFGTERLHLSVTKATWYKDRDNGLDPTTDCVSGYIQMPDLDLGIEDHLKVWNFLDIDLLQKSAGGTVEVQYRIDPYPLDAASSPWRSMGFAAATGNKHFLAPNDNPGKQQYGTRMRRLQVRVVLQRATSGLVRDVIDTMAVNFPQILPLTAAAV